MNRNTWLDKALREYASDPDFQAAGSAFEIMEQASLLMESAGISRSELAERMNVSRPYVTRLFKAPSNLTLRTMWQLALSLDAKVSVGIYLPEPEAGQAPITGMSSVWGSDGATSVGPIGSSSEEGAFETLYTDAFLNAEKSSDSPMASAVPETSYVKAA